MTDNTFDIPVYRASRENTKEFGVFIGKDVPNAGLTIPFYKGNVEEGHNIAFECVGNVVFRTARIHKRPPELKWIERHLNMTQLFIGLGNQPFAMVLGKPTHQLGQNAPKFEDLRCFIFPAGHGIMIHKGTWHDFPLCVKEPVTVLTANSPEVVEALASMKFPQEMNKGDVFKIDVLKCTGLTIKINLQQTAIHS